MVATSRIAYVECAAAVARAVRDGRLPARAAGLLRRELDRRWPSLSVVELDRWTAEQSATLAAAYALRAGDAIHLASAQVASDGYEGRFVFATWDRRQADAAKREGMDVFPAEER